MRKTIGVVLLAISLSSCAFLPERNSSTLADYSSTLYTDNEALASNNLSYFDPANSFQLAIDSAGEAQGDVSSVPKINWGNSSSFIEPACSYENFWGASTKEIAQSKTIVGISSKLSSIFMSIANYNNSNFGIISESILSFKSSNQANSYFDVIQDSIEKCSSEVFLEDFEGNVNKAPFTNSRDAKIEYFEPNDSVVIRVGRDGLIHLEVFVVTKFSVINFQVMINDENLGNQADWSILNPVINNSISRICLIEGCDTPRIALERLQSIAPTSLRVEFPKM